MPGAVVITRPLAQALPLAERVTALGRRAEVLPLLDISPLPDTGPLRAVLGRLHEFALVAFVSPNAIDAAFAHITEWPAGVTLAVVGEGSRAALAAHGINAGNADIVSPLDPVHSDSEHLLQALDLAALNGKQVLIVRGEAGRELMGDGFRAAGAHVTAVAAYRRSVPALTPGFEARLRDLLAAPNDWIVTSSEALRGLFVLLEEMGCSAGGEDVVAKMQQQHLIVPHARIAETARQLGLFRMTLTGSGDDRLLAALQSRP
ncbi:uroporphyrinogen-III synthase [Pseudoduganella umbonata]|uniref:Uroporphyrinogen-III synthase n=1 Tax=Pseudoduganella umbonata TaxID=864828 RepID=A0A4P8I055_9BURK|nr:uroporphyrinogen-III synthase [Pseudoduganella umbonata]MBB3223962.1 uroporphyrinogen-III synthase [Pseudoduganella umbonata]QCP14154.1 uroporphyrinogen III synthase [Pseudoduganella umbonata]